MTQEEILNNIERFITILQEYNANGKAVISLDDKLLLKSTYQAVHPDVHPDVSCNACCLTYMNMLVAYYEREKPKQQPAGEFNKEPEKKARTKKK